jgi:hypothetical protein
MTLRVIHKGVIQEGLVKHKEEVTKGLNLSEMKWNVTNVTILDTWPKSVE